ncbi:hypothetical protein, partial [Aeromonas veronii]|uniref:hypothetical protein n=1 Tax=Aeromonas veronii TaxID=654 RepID=UPI002246D7D5
MAKGFFALSLHGRFSLFAPLLSMYRGSAEGGITDGSSARLAWLYLLSEISGGENCLKINNRSHN